ncbi:putative membrane-bound dehydrogenase domain protein [Verrucomicrobiia bacterium DG1235]|nr:putative membrane-bound dehydrogenase domain protein [Verrucomicrobiae bacterium DG1235]
MRQQIRVLALLTLLVTSFSSLSMAEPTDRLVFTPPAAIDTGKRIVLISGDEEYRSEESCPMLAKILSQTHGFHCTVLFAIDTKTGIINPNENANIPGLESLYEADLMILGTRWRVLPGDQLQPILDYLNAGKPLIAFRTATHAFKNDDHFGGYDWQNFGKLVVGENWLNHHGEHKDQGGRGVIEPKNASHPILNSVSDIFTYSDIYGIEHLDQQAATVLLRGAVTESLDPNSPNVSDPQNDPMMPLAWLKNYPTPDGSSTGICFATTAGAAVDLLSPDLRRLFVNASYHLLDLPVPANAKVDPIDPYHPSFYGFHDDAHWTDKALRVSDFALGSSPSLIPSPERVAILGNGLSERMLHHGYFETELYLRLPDKQLTIRNLSHPGFTAGFRPHPSRNSQWAFTGADAFRPEFAHHSGEGHYPTDDEWLRQIAPDTILAFYGFNESFDGPAGLDAFRGELSAFVNHTLSQKYNDKSPSRLVLISPIAFQDLSATLDLPNGEKENQNLALYTQAMREVAYTKGIPFIDLLTPTKRWFANTTEQLTTNGAHLNAAGYQRLAKHLVSSLLSSPTQNPSPITQNLQNLVRDKNWYWLQDYQMPNGVHSYGRRFEPYGSDNYPEEIEKVRQLTANRDQAIWSAIAGESFDLAAADDATRPLTPIPTNAPERAENAYLYGQAALDSFTLADGYKIALFASEEKFPNLANPVQLTFDNSGRLWVAVMPSYPHYRPGDPRPDDKLLIYEDTDGDGVADTETVFADRLHLPIGFELAPEGVYVSQAPNSVLLRDLDGDDRDDSREIILSGFDTHDTHHAISAFTAEPSGSILMAEGVFLHTNVETAYGPVRGVNGGFYRFDPNRQHLQRLVQTHIPNPWGIAHDDWGQDFFLSTSNPDMHWMLPVEVKARYGQLIVGTESLVPEEQRVRPTSGLEFISSRHFPDTVQGDYLLNNCIGFLGAKQHTLADSEAGYSSEFRQDLFASSDPNFRPVDLEFAPDGSLYVVDWHNQLVGHMQHNARDPLRDHAHGRIYRITHNSRPLVTPPQIADATIEQLLENLKLPEARARYRTRRELRGRSASEILPALETWIQRLDASSSRYEHHLLEALWTTAGINELDTRLLRKLLEAQAPQARAAAVRLLRNHHYNFPDHTALLLDAANDPHPRVRLEAIVAASWLDNPDGRSIAEAAGKHPLDDWMTKAYQQALSNLGGTIQTTAESATSAPPHLSPEAQAAWTLGSEIYSREGHCATCHQPDGKGLPAAQFPPLAGTSWVNGNPSRLIDLTLHGLMGPIDVNGQHYPGHVPMTQFANVLTDQEIAAVLTYVRNAFGNQSSPVSRGLVEQVRASSAEQTGFWSADALNEKYSADNETN